MSTVPRRFAPEIPRLGEAGTLGSPGVVPSPLVADQSLSLVAQALQAIDATGNLAGQLRADSARQEQRSADTQRVLQEHARVLDLADEGRATTDARTAVPDIVRQIRDGSFRPADGQSDSDFISGLVAQHTTDASSAYSNRFSEIATPELSLALADLRASATRSLRTDASAQLLARAASETDAKTLGDIAQALRAVDPLLSEFAARDAVARSALEYQSKYGSAAGLKSIATRFLPADFDPAVLAKARADRLTLDQRDANQLVFATLNDNKPVADQLAALDSARGALGEQRTSELRGLLVRRAQDQFEATLRSRVMDGSIGGEELATTIRERGKLPIDSPEYLDPRVGATILGQLVDKRRGDVAKQQVVNVLSGTPGVLVESIHGKALGEVVGPQGLGLIDQSNRVADPVNLAGVLVASKLLPNDIKATLTASLQSDRVEDVTGAAEAVGLVGASSSRLRAEFYQGAPPAMVPILDRVFDAADRGQLRDDAGRAKVVEDLKRLQTTTIAKREGDERTVAEINSRTAIAAKRGIDLAVDGVLQSVREQFGHTKNSFLGMDWLASDPMLQTPQEVVGDMVRGWITETYRRQRANLSEDQAMAAAKKYAAAQVKNHIDFVRWGDSVAPVAIDVGEGLRMPEHLRWGDGFAEEASSDLKGTGFQPDDVVTMRPYLNPAHKAGDDPTAAMGWVYITHDGDVLRDDKGNTLVYRPSDRIAQANAEFRDLLDRQERDFRKPQLASSLLRAILNTATPVGLPHPSK